MKDGVTSWVRIPPAEQRKNFLEKIKKVLENKKKVVSLQHSSETNTKKQFFDKSEKNYHKWRDSDTYYRYINSRKWCGEWRDIIYRSVAEWSKAMVSKTIKT